MGSALEARDTKPHRRPAHAALTHLPGCSDSALWISPQLYYRIPGERVRRSVFPYTATDAYIDYRVSADPICKIARLAWVRSPAAGFCGAGVFRGGIFAAKIPPPPSKSFVDGVVPAPSVL